MGPALEFIRPKLDQGQAQKVCRYIGTLSKKHYQMCTLLRLLYALSLNISQKESMKSKQMLLTGNGAKHHVRMLFSPNTFASTTQHRCLSLFRSTLLLNPWNSKDIGKQLYLSLYPVPDAGHCIRYDSALRAYRVDLLDTMSYLLYTLHEKP